MNKIQVENDNNLDMLTPTHSLTFIKLLHFQSAETTAINFHFTTMWTHDRVDCVGIQVQVSPVIML